jgi:tRNA (cmo5U34)-methyltransferase
MKTSPFSPEEYEIQVRKIIPFYEEIISQVLDFVGVAIAGECNNWLDAGCGTGFLVSEARERFPKAHFLLADPSAVMLDFSKKRLRGTGGERFSFVQKGTEELDSEVQEGSLDVITATLSHDYFDSEERRRATKNCFDFLRKGGVYVNFEVIKGESALETELGLSRWKEFQLKEGRSAEEIASHLARFGKDYFPISSSDHLRLLKEAGFKNLGILWISYLQGVFYGIK